ncbi:hypothetical protein JOM56_004821 [Amanita muscaria]
MNKSQTTRNPRPLPLPPGQRQPQPAPPHVAQHPQQSYFQVPPVPAHNSQWTVSPLSRPLLEQSAVDTNHDYGSQRHGQQQLYPVPPPVARPLPAQPNYNSYQPTAGYPRYYVPQPVASPQPQLAYYPHSQPLQQQQRWYHALLQCLIQVPEKHQRFDSPSLNRQAQQHAPPPTRPQFQLLLPAQDTGVYPGQSQRSSRGDGYGWLNNVQPNVNKGDQVGNHGGPGGRGGHGHGARGGSLSGNKGEIPDRHRGGYMDSGGEGRRGGQSGGRVRAHWSPGGNFGGAASMQAEGRNAIPTSAEPAAVPVATQLQGAQNVNVSGNPRFTNIGVNKGNLTTVNHYGGTHGLENLKDFVSFAALHDSAEQDPDRRCHPGTRNTVLMRLRDWFANPNPTDRIIWLHGPAGAGKSAIAQTIADEYKKRGMAATFFFYRSDPNRNNGNRLFPTIAWQLAFSIPPTKDFIVHGLDKAPHLPTKRAETQFEELVAHPFHAMNHIATQSTQTLHPAPVVIIDGVDECSDELLQRRFLTVIGDAVKDTRIPLRFLIISRPEALIEETLNKFKDFTVAIDLAKLDDSNRDIQKYLKDKFSEIASNRGLDPAWPGQEIIEEILSKSSGNFIFSSLVVRFISDEDFDPQFLLNIVRNLAPRGNMSPFALLDELYFEILKRQRDQDLLKTCLALLVGRISIKRSDLHKHDAMLMNVSEKDLHTRLRRMRSLLKFEPFIDVYHKSFLDFLQDSSRSGQYYVSKRSGLKRYLELFVDLVVRHVSTAIEEPNRHKTCHFSPIFNSFVEDYPPEIVLSVEDWREALEPLLDLQDKLLNTLKPMPCRVTQLMRDLLLHLVVLQGKSQHIFATHVPESNMNETVTGWISGPVPESMQVIPETDLDSCLSVLLSSLQETNLTLVVDGAIIHHMSSLLAFDYAKTAARVRSVSDAQKLIHLIVLLNNNESFLRQCGPDAARKAAHLASKIYARVPILPLSLLNRPAGHSAILGFTLEFICQNVLISRILDHKYILPVLGIYGKQDELQGSFGNVDEQTELINKWLERSSPNFSTRTRVMLQIARIIRYIHSMDITLHSAFMTSVRGGYCILMSVQ